MDASRRTRVNDRLRQERIGRNWRQRDLADQLGTTVVTVKRWERGYQQPSPYFRVKLCAIFGRSAEELGLVERVSSLSGTKQLDVVEDAPDYLVEMLPLWTVPYMRNPHFTGREDLLEQLALRLSFENQRDATTRRVMLNQPQAVKGLGGIGKTQIAVEYAYRVREQMPHVHILWINAASEEAILNSFAALAEWLPSVKVRAEKDQHTLVATIIRGFEQCPNHWLLIFDNADDLSLVQQYFPKQGNGSVLLTTRAHAVASLASSLEVEALGMMEGTHFLLQRTQRLNATDEEINEATNIVIVLDGFPLALDQAGAYIEETGCSFGDYLYIYQQHRTTLLARRGRQASNYPDSVATTWSLSFEKIESTNPVAADLLRLCAFLAPDHIPEELLREGAPYWPSELQKAVVDLFVFNQMLKDLLKFSLIKRLTEGHIVSIHRLVQVVQRDRMDREEQHYWATCVVYGVNAVFPEDTRTNVALWSQCQRYLEQVQICDLLIQEYTLGFSEAADVLHRAGHYLYEHALYTLAEGLYQRALHIWEQQPETKFLQIASALNSLGLLYKEQGKQAEAEEYYQQALYTMEQSGSDNLKAAPMLNNLAIIYKDRGRYTEAEALYKHILRIVEQSEPDNPNVAIPLNNLANLYLLQGKYDEAEALFLQTLGIRERQLGLEHPKVTFSLNKLGRLYLEQGRYIEAEAAYQRSLSIAERVMGSEHIHVATALNGLADLHCKQKRYEQAESLYRRALAIREQMLGVDHSEVAFPLNGLANLYREQGQYEEAEMFYQQTLAIRRQYLSPQHPDIAETLHDLAHFHHLRQEIPEALALYQQAQAIREQVYGPRHPKTEETKNAIKKLLQEIRQPQQVSIRYPLSGPEARSKSPHR